MKIYKIQWDTLMKGTVTLDTKYTQEEAIDSLKTHQELTPANAKIYIKVEEYPEPTDSH